MKQLRTISTIALVLFYTLLSACGGSSSDGSSSNGSELLTGVFIDSPVKGLRWVSGDNSGTTDDTGAFSFSRGAIVQFFVGDILLGQAVGDSVLTPIDLVPGAADISNPTVTNIVRFLLTLDNDDNPSNGIELTTPVVSLATGESIDFAQSAAAFESNGGIQILVSALTAATGAGARPLVSEAVAQGHFENSIKDLIAGNYGGTYSGDISGQWNGSVNAAGVLTGSATSIAGEVVTFAGTVSTDGAGTTSFRTSGGTSDGTVFSGMFDTNGNASGSWDYFGQQSGSWSGAKLN